jgi:hypothetical protein
MEAATSCCSGGAPLHQKAVLVAKPLHMPFLNRPITAKNKPQKGHQDSVHRPLLFAFFRLWGRAESGTHPEEVRRFYLCHLQEHYPHALQTQISSRNLIDFAREYFHLNKKTTCYRKELPLQFLVRVPSLSVLVVQHLLPEGKPGELWNTIWRGNEIRLNQNLQDVLLTIAHAVVEQKDPRRESIKQFYHTTMHAWQAHRPGDDNSQSPISTPAARIPPPELNPTQPLPDTVYTPLREALNQAFRLLGQASIRKLPRDLLDRKSRHVQLIGHWIPLLEVAFDGLDQFTYLFLKSKDGQEVLDSFLKHGLTPSASDELLQKFVIEAQEYYNKHGFSACKATGVSQRYRICLIVASLY